MADFCCDCGTGVWGSDPRDLADITTPDDTSAGRFAFVLCEGCGPIHVDHNGRKIAADPRRDGEEAARDNIRPLVKRTASTESDILCALAIVACLIAPAIAIMQGNGPRNWITFALSSTASLLALRRIGIWAGG